MKLSNQSILWAVLLVVALFIAWNSYQSLRYQSRQRLSELEEEFERLDYEVDKFIDSEAFWKYGHPLYEQEAWIERIQVKKQIEKERRFLGLPVKDSDD